MTNPFSDYAQYYDLLYGDKDYAAEAEYFGGLCKRYGVAPISTLLEFGAGTGRHQAAFRDLGFEIEGIEISSSMIQESKKTGAVVREGDIRSYRDNRKFDGVMALFHVMSYMDTDEKFDSALHTARAHLEPGGLFIFDFWFKDAVIAQKPETRIKKLKSRDIEIVRIAQPTMITERDMVLVDYTIFGKLPDSEHWQQLQESHPMRYFSIDTIETRATVTGFTVNCFEETLTGKKPSEQSWGVTAVLCAC